MDERDTAPKDATEPVKLDDASLSTIVESVVAKLKQSTQGKEATGGPSTELGKLANSTPSGLTVYLSILHSHH